MKKYIDVVFNREGNPIAGAFVRVKLAGTATDAVLYSDNGSTVKANPVSTDSNGSFSFYVADGRYDLIYSGAGFTTRTDGDVVIEDSVDKFAELSAPSGASLVGYLPAGTGAVATDVQQQLLNIQAWTVNVKDAPFYAPSDGITGASTKIQAAIDSGAGDIFIPDGEYLIDADLIVPDSVCIYFSKQAIFKASANGRIFFKSTAHAYFSQIHNPQLNGNGKTGVVGFDMTNFRLNAGIYNPFMTLMDTGFIGRQGCFGTFISNPTAYGVTNPIVLILNNSGLVIDTPNFDNSVVAGGNAAGNGIYIQDGAGSNLGAVIRGGYIQGFNTGIDDRGIGTIVDSVYFEACTNADISGSVTCRESNYINNGHWGTVGACAYKLRNTDAVTIFNPTMGSGARTALYDIDSTNTNCTEYRPASNASYNAPTGSLTYVNSLPVQTTGSFTPVIAGSTTAGTATYTVQAGKYTRTGNTVSFQIGLTWTGHTGTGGMLITGLPAGLAPVSFSPAHRFNAFPQFAFAGPIAGAAFIGAGTTLGMRQLSAAGAETLIVMAASGSIDVWGAYEIS